jgi:hypothetical protein
MIVYVVAFWRNKSFDFILGNFRTRLLHLLERTPVPFSSKLVGSESHSGYFEGLTNFCLCRDSSPSRSSPYHKSIHYSILAPLEHRRNVSITFTDKYLIFLLDSYHHSSAFCHFLFTFYIEIVSRTPVLTPGFSVMFIFIHYNLSVKTTWESLKR